MPENQNQIGFFVGTEEAINEAKKHLETTSIKTLDALDVLEKQYLDIQVSSIKDLAGYNRVSDGYKEVKKMITLIENKRKEITKPALTYQREVKAFADGISDRLKVVSDHLLVQKTFFEDAKRAEEQRLFKIKCDKLCTAGWEVMAGNYVLGVVHLSPEQISEMDKETLDFNIELGKKEKARKQAEQDRINQEKREIEEAKAKLEAEKEQMASQMKEMEAKMAEIQAQNEALIKTYETVDEKINEESTTGNEEAKKPIEEPTAKIEESQPEKDLVIPKEFYDGFESYRKKLVSLLNDQTIKLTRKDLLIWAKEVTI